MVTLIICLAMMALCVLWYLHEGGNLPFYFQNSHRLPLLLTFLVIAVAVVFGVFGDRSIRSGADDCHTEWDGRSNPTVCD